MKNTRILTGETTSMADTSKVPGAPLGPPGLSRLGPKTVARFCSVILFSSE